jgi:hypothetical protein
MKRLIAAATSPPPGGAFHVKRLRKWWLDRQYHTWYMASAGEN